MPVKKIRAFANSDVVTIVWQTDNAIKDCRGFALERATKGKTNTSFVSTWVGFKGVKHEEGESQPSTVWPIQRYIWSDYQVQTGQELRYRAIPMVGPAVNLAKASQSEWSTWTPWVKVGTGQTPGLEAYFNRGIVPALWLARQSPSKKSLQQDIDTKGSKNRNFLSGELRKAMLALLAQAKNNKTDVYCALYELDDPELIDALKAIGAKCNLLLGSGAYKPANKKKNKPAEPDENAEIRKDLKEHSSLKVFDRLVKSPHFAHNKVAIFCDNQGKPSTLWTGSTNWTVTGLCTQVNNGILIRSPQLAIAYLDRWNLLKDAGASYPSSLAKAGSTPAQQWVGKVNVTAWNAPMLNLVDLTCAEKLINAAQDGVLFLMFNPGPKNTLLNTILALDPEKLFIHGVINQDPGGKKAPLIKLTHKGKQLPPGDLTAVIPAALQRKTGWFDKEFTFNRVMIHSKVVVIDPFGKKPVVMTGSHNLGPKASKDNDDNLVIIENAPGLASEYAVNILGVYGHYKWMYNLSLKKTKDPKSAAKTSPQYDGNYDDDKWQDWYTKGAHLREIQFWLG